MHQQGTGVVLAAGVMRLVDQCLADRFGVIVSLQQLADALVVEAGPDAVADQQETVAGLQLAVAVVHHQVLIQTHGALEHVLHARLFPHMVLGQAQQLAVAPQVGAAVADVRQGVAPAAQHQGGKGGQQRLAAAVGL